MQDAVPLTLWMIDLESASKDLGRRSELGRFLDGGAIRSSRVPLAIIKTTKIGSFPLPGIAKPFPSKSNSHPECIRSRGTEIEIAAKTVVKI
jgi:hypothetical protein